MKNEIKLANISGFNINQYQLRNKDLNKQTPNYLYMQKKNNINNYKIYNNLYNPKELIKKSSSLYFVNKDLDNSILKKIKQNSKNVHSKKNQNKKISSQRSYSQNSINNKSFDNISKIKNTKNNKNKSTKNISNNKIKINNNKNHRRQNSETSNNSKIKKNKQSKNFSRPLSQQKLNISFNHNPNNYQVKKKRIKTPILIKKPNYKISLLDNSVLMSNSSILNGTHHSTKNLDLNNSYHDYRKSKKAINNAFEKKMRMNNNLYLNNSFQPKNIFQQFKRKNKKTDNKTLFIGSFIIDEKNNEQNITKINKTGVAKSQTHNTMKTNDTINSNLNLIGSHVSSTTNNIGLNIGINNSNNNINCHEIFFNINALPKKNEVKINEKNNNNLNNNSNNINNNTENNNIFEEIKPKIFKCKKIKCMHDLSKTGLNGDEKKVNQDSYFIFKNFVQDFDNIFMGVCDGHGYYGHEVSGYIKENLPMDLNHMIKTKKLNIKTDNLTSIIKNVFIMENNSLLRNKQIDSDLSGSTCISVIFTPKKLIISNLGDSRCILGKFINKKWLSQNLSKDHKPTIPEEAERIKKKGGRIHPMRDDDGSFIGPMRVYMKDKEMPGLAMTRSFGDYYGSLAGTISEPEVTEYVFKEEDKFFLLASDGLFEFIQSQDIIDVVKDYYLKNDIVTCCEFLYKEACRKWLKEEEDVIDDITIIMVFLEDCYE